MKEDKQPFSKLPGFAGKFAKQSPDVWAAYQSLGASCASDGPIRGQTARLIKLTLAIGANSEGAVHSQVRRAIAENIGLAELRHVAILAIPTLGFPAAMRVLSWIEDVSRSDQP